MITDYLSVMQSKSFYTFKKVQLKIFKKTLFKYQVFFKQLMFSALSIPLTLMSILAFTESTSNKHNNRYSLIGITALNYDAGF